MLRNLGIRWQILAALTVPLLVLVAAGTQITRQSVREMTQAQQTLELVSTASSVSELVRGLSSERLLTVQALTGDPAARLQLARVRSANDVRISRIQRDISISALPARYRAVLTSASAGSTQLADLRTVIDAGAIGVQQAARSYNQIIAADTGLPAEIATRVQDPAAGMTFRRFGALSQAIDMLSREQLTGLIALVSSPDGQITAQQRQSLAIDRALHDQLMAEVVRSASTAQRMELSQMLSSAAARTADLDTERAALQGPITSVSRKDPGATGHWLEITSARAGVLNTVLDAIADDGVLTASATVSSSRLRAELTAAAASLLVLVILLMALLMARRIAQPLHRLTADAARIRDELPVLVEQLNAGHDAEIEIPAVPVTGQREVARLAAAFTDVNRVAIQIAREQAELRAAVSEMFVNVARRNQVLLARQLAFIDQLERHEADPDALDDLFRLDHLATRMRRNAESLLVLAGIDSGRRLRDPMLLSDVIRTATSEIEHYERVTLALGADPYVHAHFALPIAHLLAELLENATNFSDPGTTVVVMAAVCDDGLRVTVADDGLGIPPKDLLEINERLGAPPAADVLGSQRLGFFVVGRLAHRLNAVVHLSSGRLGGTCAQIDLPPALFLDISCPEHFLALEGSSADVQELPAPGLGLMTAPEPAREPAPVLEPAPAPEPAPVPEPVLALEAGPVEPSPAGPGLFAGFRPMRTSAPSLPQPRAELGTDTEANAADEQETGEGAPPPWENFAERDILPARAASLRTALGLVRRNNAAQPQPESSPVFAAEPAARPPLPSRTPAAGAPVTGTPADPPRRRYRDDGLPRPAQWPDSARGPAQAQSPATGPHEPMHDVMPGPVPVPAAGPGPVVEPNQSPVQAIPDPRTSHHSEQMRSSIASQALSELSKLSSYTPAAMETSGHADLRRRVPPAVPAASGNTASANTAAQPDDAGAPVSQRARTAANVRAMLSSFRAGVDRGSTSPSAKRPVPRSRTGPQDRSGDSHG